MIASNVDKAALQRAAEQIGVTVEINSITPTRHRVKVNPGPTPASAWQIAPNRPRLCPICGERVAINGETTDGRLIGNCGDAASAARWANGKRWSDKRGDSKYQRTSVAVMFHDGRRVNAVCWHGFRDYFRAVYELAPKARFYTALDKWLGSDDFEARYRESGHRNIGSLVAPVCAAEACRCPESGRAV